MFTLFRMVITLLIVVLLLPCMVCGAELNIAKIPEGLRMENPDPSHPYLTAKDRALWKTVLNWCDECDERALPATQANDGEYGWIFTTPIGDQQYIVDIQCYTTMRQSEHIYYKIRKMKGNIESRLLVMELYDYIEGFDGSKETNNGLKGQFVRFTDSLAYGLTSKPPENTPELILYREYRGAGGCGFNTVYDVSGDSPKVKEFRARLVCTEEFPPVETWKQYPARQRAKWRVVTNPLRDEWRVPPNPFETRCGWYNWSNDETGNYSCLYDCEGKWDINYPQPNKILSESDLPVFAPDQKIKTEDGNEFACVCMDAKVSLKSKRFIEVKNMRVQSPNVCRQDPGLKQWNNLFK